MVPMLRFAARTRLGHISNVDTSCVYRRAACVDHKRFDLTQGNYTNVVAETGVAACH